MDRVRNIVILLMVAAMPAAAPPFFSATPELCFTAGSTTYRLAARADAADYRVRIDNNAAHPDLRMALVRRRLHDAPAALDGVQSGEVAAAAVGGVEALEAWFAKYLPQVVLACVVPLAGNVSPLSTESRIAVPTPCGERLIL